MFPFNSGSYVLGGIVVRLRLRVPLNVLIISRNAFVISLGLVNFQQIQGIVDSISASTCDTAATVSGESGAAATIGKICDVIGGLCDVILNVILSYVTS